MAVQITRQNAAAKISYISVVGHFAFVGRPILAAAAF
jgi:hypothetical protein